MNRRNGKGTSSPKQERVIEMKLKSVFTVRGRFLDIDYTRNFVTIDFCRDRARLFLSRKCEPPSPKELREGVLVKAEGRLLPVNGRFEPVADKLILEEE
jgi:hypothetical protein